MKEDYGIILDSVKGKAKGVLMQNQSNEENIPQMVGVSKIQIFLLIAVGTLMGACAFGLGYIFHQNEDRLTNSNIGGIIPNKYKIGKEKRREAQKEKEEGEEEKEPEKSYSIFIGKYNTIEEAQKVQNKIQIKLGKLATLKQTNDGILMHIGPFESESLANNERSLMAQKALIMGSVTNGI